ncbi:flotillin family protein (plasmid) [Acaryochloris sp. 'Moss Beach']|uniref:flotillin family protein n=1 Tax=Acaryochloris TaxID=155977 RepID=UPI001BAFCE12|nr:MULTISPECIES: SPFH domain-containing protein [Acaryochloris]QUY40373.1 flotillin family protein [Acaryochloris marina S15]UJB72379.1 flotillin family protein [Acaryochloris sp. 'Moss Beach']
MNQQLILSQRLDAILAQSTEKTTSSQEIESSVKGPSSPNLWSVGLPLTVTVLGSLVGIWFLKAFLVICKPNEVVILSGRKWKTPNGQKLGYRVLTGGRAIRIPIVETVKRMDVTTMAVPVEVHNAYSKGGIPLHIQAIANIKISSDSRVVGNAIERFLGHKRTEIIRVAQETLAGYLRGVVATLTPEQVNEDRLQFAERIASDVSRELRTLGLHLDILKIQSVADDVDYLSSLGRQRIAMILRDAEVAESDALTTAEQIEAECQEQAAVAQTQDRTVVLEQENQLRKIKAKLERQARSEEEITVAATNERRAKVEQILQKLRADVERLRLQADQVLPAQAQQQAAELREQGDAAILAENARAAARVNDMLAEVWQDIGTDASQVFLIQQIETVLREAVQIPERLHLHQVKVVDNGDGEAVASLLRVYPQVVHQFLDSLHQTLGIDIVGTLTQTHGPQSLTHPLPQQGA